MQAPWSGARTTTIIVWGVVTADGTKIHQIARAKSLYFFLVMNILFDASERIGSIQAPKSSAAMCLRESCLVKLILLERTLKKISFTNS